MADEKKNVAPQDAPPHTGPAVTDKDKAAPSKVEPPPPGGDKAAPGKTEPPAPGGDKAAPGKAEPSVPGGDKAVPGKTEPSVPGGDKAAPGKAEPSAPGGDKAAPGKAEPSAPGGDKAAPGKTEPSPVDKGKAALSGGEHTQQTFLPGMGVDAPAPSGKVINLSDIASGDKGGKAAPAPEKKEPQADQMPKRRGRPPQADKGEKGPEPHTGRPAKADKAARGVSPAPGVLDKVVCTPSSRQRNNLHFTHENPSCIPYGAGCYAASRRSWTSIGVRTPRPRWRRRKL